MIEARIFTESLSDAELRLRQLGAHNKGHYEIIDDIYRHTDDSITLVDEFLRLRVIPKNIWNEKSVILAIKKTRLQGVGKNSEIPLKLQFDTKDEAESYYADNLNKHYVKDFSFSRIGWQYFVGDDVVDIEIIEDEYLSVEFKSQTPEGLDALLAAFNVSIDNVITGPSVVAVKDRLQLQEGR